MRKKNFWDNPKVKNSKEWVLIGFEILIIIFSSYNLFFTGKIFPNTFVAGIKLGGKTETQAIKILSEGVTLPEKITLSAKDQNYYITPESIGLRVDFDASVKNALSLHRTGNILYDFSQRLTALFKRNYLGLRVTFDKDKLDKSISIVAGQVEEDATSPSLKIVSEKVIVDPGKVGYRVDRELLSSNIMASFSFIKAGIINIPLEKIDPTLNKDEAERYLARGEKLLNKKLVLSYDSQNFTYQKEEVFNLLDPKDIYDNQKTSEIVSEVADKLNHGPVNSVFVFEEGKVKEFTPSKDGVKVDENLLSQMIIGNLRTLEETDTESSSVNIPVSLTPPEIKTSDVNNLGIKELIGKGVSYFTGSIPGRIHNINLAASKFKGVLVKPGETLSFTSTVGDISTLTGYKQAYIISQGKTILGDGGGVCQVSTTLFRAALNAGLPIIERTAHAYRVGYYEQSSPPGLDATVYSPTVDLKIKNDTSNHILIQTEVDSKKMVLTFEIYGTKDGRIAKITKPQVTNQIAPPEDIYQDDPTLPQGKIVQTEHKAWGGTVTFSYTVEKNGEITYKKTFTSRYQPWVAVYLKGTGNL